MQPSELYGSPEEHTLATLEGDGWLCALSDRCLYLQGRYILAVGSQRIAQEGKLELKPGDIVRLELRQNRNRWPLLAAMLSALLGVLLRATSVPANSGLFRGLVLCLLFSLAAIPLQRLFRRQWVEVESWHGQILLPAPRLRQEAVENLQGRLEGLKTFALQEQEKAQPALKNSVLAATRATYAALASGVRAAREQSGAYRPGDGQP